VSQAFYFIENKGEKSLDTVGEMIIINHFLEISQEKLNE
jgi:hypothetical protein